MSASSHQTPTPEHWAGKNGSLGLGFLIVGVIALAISALGAWLLPVQFAHSWLMAFMFFYTIAAGAFFWVVLHHSVDANWTALVRRQFENMTSIFPVLVLAFVPLFLCGKNVWRWMDPEVARTDTLLQLKAAYLNCYHLFFFDGKEFSVSNGLIGFLPRAVFYLTFFTLASRYFRRLSVAQDTSGSPVYTIRMRRWSYLGILFFAGCVTFSGFDWLMSIDFHWSSTMWGVYIFAGCIQSSMAAAIIIVWLLRQAGYLKPVTGEHALIMGKLLLAFTVFWAYIAFDQYMLIWYANIPEETIFFLNRNVGSWTYLSMFLVAGHFVFPFVFLLAQTPKRSFGVLSIICVWILMMHAVDMFWIIMPQVDPAGMKLHWLDLTCFAGLGCLVVWFFLRSLGQAQVFPSRDPRLMDCVKLTN